MSRHRLVVSTWNVWGLSAPGVYTRDRAIARGAISGSPAAHELDPSTAWHHRLPLLVSALAPVRPDLVALQENAELPEGGTLAGDLAARLGLQVIEARTTTVAEGHDVGLALLTASPVRSEVPLPIVADLYGYPPPLAVEVEVHDLPLTCVVLHLPLARVGDREPIVRELVQRLDELDAPLLLVCGDLNCEPHDPLLRPLLDAGFADASSGVAATMPNPWPVIRLDYVLVRARETDVRVLEPRALGADADAAGFLPSDHLGLAVVLELRQRPARPRN